MDLMLSNNIRRKHVFCLSLIHISFINGMKLINISKSYVGKTDIVFSPPETHSVIYF